MKYTVTQVLDPKRSPDAVGEYLRSEIFDEKNGQERGCYSTFDVNPRVFYLDDIPRDAEYAEGPWKHVALHQQTGMINAYWYWDGDGTLVFRLPDGSYLSNTDCKKSYGWEWWPECPGWATELNP